MIRHLRRAASALREPTPRRRLALPPLEPGPAVIGMAAGPDSTVSALRLANITLPEPLLILSLDRSRKTKQSTDALAALSATARTAFPIGAQVQPGSREVSLGERGWDRIDVAARSSHLWHVDVPTEMADAESISLVAPTGREPGVLHHWGRFVHPNQRMRTVILRDIGAAELSLAIEACYLLMIDAHTAGPAAGIVAATSDRIAAELLAGAVYRLREQARGIEAVSPWESPVVQHLAELRAGVLVATDLAIRAALPDNVRGWLERLALLLGCRVEAVSDGGRDVDG